MQASIKDSIKEHLQKIHDNSKKLSSKMSVPLRELQEFVSTNIKKIQTDDAEYLLKGVDKLEGLIELCGTKNKFSDSLKKSASTAIDMMLNLVGIESPPIIFEVFLNLDTDDYLKLKLSEHILQDTPGKLSALELAYTIQVSSKAKAAFHADKGLHLFEKSGFSVRKMAGGE